MSKTQHEQILAAEFGINSNYVIDLFHLFRQNALAVDDEWRAYFTDFLKKMGEVAVVNEPQPARAAASTAAPAVSTPAVVTAPKADAPAPQPVVAATPPKAEVPAAKPAAPAVVVDASMERIPLRGPALRIVENMETSLSVPIATSQRQIPIKLLDENRRLMNQFLEPSGRKVSFTHIIAYALVKALDRFPQLNAFFEVQDGTSYRVQCTNVNVGVAVDVTKKDGSRTLLVPNIKAANKMDFAELVAAYDDVVKRARAGKLQVPDFQGTTISLTNPGTLGTTASNPRLMAGQALIIATGAIEYPPEFLAMAPEAISRIGISKVMTITSTYDHRIVQGAESGSFLAFVDELLRGKHRFYNTIFADLGIPYKPYRWAVDSNPAILGIDRHRDEVRKQASVLELINAHRVRGHLVADIDPLGAMQFQEHPELDIETYKLTIWDLDREFITGGLGNTEKATLRQILLWLRKYYCSKVGIEYRHIQNPEEKEWIRSQVERDHPPVPVEVKKQLLWKLISAEQFERFLGVKYLGQKRFSVEGAETIVALLDQVIESAPSRGIDDIVIGMAHRGRLNVIANVIGHFCERIFTSFEGSVHPKFPHDQGDVKYHQGASGVRDTAHGKQVTVSVLSNPSHLEFVDPVVQGVVRARQDQKMELATKSGILTPSDRYSKFAVLLHGDSAFAGEGIVPETLNMSQLAGYSTCGTLHFIINNQVGFTTTAEDSRSSTYSTDVAKMVQAPIFHINGDDPEAAYHILQLALDYRQKYHKDIVLDVIGFRRHGHNEGDEPTYTLPIMYQRIRTHEGVRTIYSKRLIREGVITAEGVDGLIADRVRRYENALLGAKEIVSRRDVKLVLPNPKEPEIIEEFSTSVNQDVLKKLAHAATAVPLGFNINPKIVGLLTKRAKMVDGEIPVDWAMGESLAFGSILLEGITVRASGQDTVRGTFSQRHAVFFDAHTAEPWMPLTTLSPEQGQFHLYDSPLSEAGVLGFEYGYSVAHPEALVIWEAQFGDFANAAQVIVDQFIAAGEEKWNQTTRLVLLLPHGYEGQGPEHSSARLERYLQLCAGGNMQVVNCTNAAQYFHLLRRQVKMTHAKPLIVMTPKSLLRHPGASSPITDFTQGTFQPVVLDPATSGLAKRVLLCSGKVYYELKAKLQELKDTQTAIIRLEQLYPFPKALLLQLLNSPGLSQATDIRWVQEEPANQGAWTFVEPRLRQLLRQNQSVRYVGLPASGTSATGSYIIHQMQQKQLLTESFEN